MDLRVAPKDSHIVPNTYSITINVPSNKIIDRKSLGIARCTFGRLPSLSQRQVIQETFEVALSASSITKYDFRFEKTKAGKEHMHAILFGTEDQVLSVQSYVQSKLGFPNLDPSWLCKYEATVVSPKFWVDYMTKEDMELTPRQICPNNILLMNHYYDLAEPTIKREGAC